MKKKKNREGKKQAVVIFVTLLAITLATYLNMRVSFRRSRDVTRKTDLWTIHDGLIEYQKDNASFPESQDGKIVACLGGYDEEGIPQRIACQWGEDPLSDIFYPDFPAYIEKLPDDPQEAKGATYLYLSNGRHFQVFASLEGGESEPEYNPEVVARGLMCGDRLCNFGRSDPGTPLDISIEEYENELRRLKLLKENAVKEE